MRVVVACALADSVLLGEPSLQKMRDSLPWTPMNRHANFDAASFIFGGKIFNRITKQTHKKTVNDISTPCILACG